MQHFDMPDPRHFIKTGIFLVLALLALLIAYLALSADPYQPQVTPPPHGATPPLVDTLDVTEQAIPLVDGRTVLCLVFTAPTKTTSCDWATARATR